MKLVEQSILVFDEGRSEKVFEIDLLEIGPDRYVVNYRYGKRGAPLRDSTKTPLPVSQADARLTYDRTIQAQEEKGYRRTTGAIPGGGATPRASDPGQRPSASTPPAPAAATPTPAASSASSASSGFVRTGAPAREARVQRILDKLARGDTSPPPAAPAPSTARGTSRFLQRARAGRTRNPIPFNRTIWRAGELRIREAEPSLLRLLGGYDARRDYALAWALGRLGTQAAVEPLAGLLRASTQAPMVRRMVVEALRALTPDQRADFVADHIPQLPAALQEAAKGEDPTAFQAALAAWCQSAPPAQHGAVIELLYLLDTPAVRPAILDWARQTPLKPPFFRAVRGLFKTAEFREDAQLFGLLAWRFEKTRSNGGRIRNARLRQGLSQPNANTAYTMPTRLYLRRRVWRTLRRLGNDQSPSFVRLAVGVLAPYTDADAVAPVQRSQYDVRRRQSKVEHWDAFYPYWAFNHLLYRHSPRYWLKRKAGAYRMREGWTPQHAAPSVREEAFPALWDAQPAGLVHLLVASSCAPVHQFGARALRSLPHVVGELDAEVAALFLGRPYEETQRLGLDIARRVYHAGQPDRALLLALVGSPLAEARQQGWSWIELGRMHLEGDLSFLARLLRGPVAESRQRAALYIRQLLLPTSQLQRLARALLQEAVSPEAPLTDEAVALDVLHFVQSLGVWGGEVDEGLLQRLLASPLAPIRGLGVTLLQQLPDATLLERRNVVLDLAVHPLADLRMMIRPVVARLAAASPAFGAWLASALAEHLRSHRLVEGVPASVLALFRQELAGAATSVPMETVWALLRSRHAYAQELAGVLLTAHAVLPAVDLPAVITLLSHEILAVRQAGQALLERNQPQVVAQLDDAIRALDAKWADSRTWAFRFFGEQIPLEAYTAEILVAMADSVREDVQAFARQMLLRCFQDADGVEYLRKLSEHPSVQMQGFATGYLERYAAGDLTRLRELVPFFTAVFTQINRGRAAKTRLLAFLRAEARASEAAAEIIAPVLGRAVATLAIQDRAALLEALFAIHQQYPSIPVPLSVVTPPLGAPSPSAPPRVTHAV